MDSICKLEKYTKQNINAACKKNLSLGDDIILISEAKPKIKIKNIKILNKLKLLKNINIVNINKKIPPDNGILFPPTNFWCFSPE